MKAQRGRRGIALLILNFGARRGRVVNARPRPLYSWQTATVVIVK
jgi:hypothetical protein